LTGSKPSRSQLRARVFQTTIITFTWLGIFRSDGTITKLAVGAITEMIDVSVHTAILDYDIHHMCILSENFYYMARGIRNVEYTF